MVPTQEGVWNVVILLSVITSRHCVRSNTTMLAEPPHLSDICQITHQQL